jgi:elongation factor Ts
MANYTAADVKKLRDETDAPMMECKSALEEAGGDYDRAKEILREKGKAAAGKKAGRSTGAGVVAIAASGGTVAGVVLECETDFVSRNEGFVEIAQRAAQQLLSGNADLGAFAEEAVAKFRENSRVGRTIRLEGLDAVGTYVHHDKSKGAVVAGSGDADALRTVAIQVVASPAEVVRKEDLSQDMLAHELEIETQRAINEGKPENIAKNIAQGRVNKEFIKKAVLLEQPFYKDPAKSVQGYLSEEAKGTTVAQFAYLAVGQE